MFSLPTARHLRYIPQPPPSTLTYTDNISLSDRTEIFQEYLVEYLNNQVFVSSSASGAFTWNSRDPLDSPDQDVFSHNPTIPNVPSYKFPFFQISVTT